jgi:D-amino-acid dehydrogenase
MPYLGRPRDWKNLIVAAGHAMMGLSLAPVTGQLVAELVEGGEVGEGREVLSPDRFTGR